MSKRAFVLVEGQTEERFVKDVLAPAFWPMEFFLIPTLVVTRRVKDGPNFKGGMTNFAKFENDMNRLLQGAGGSMVTTIVDYYGLPTDFPGMASRPLHGTALQRVTHVEAAVHAHFGGRADVLPFLALHEFEAWLFCSDTELPRALAMPNRVPDVARIRATFVTPEDINDHPDTAPSKRIANMFPTYRKTLHGPAVAAKIGLDEIRRACPHFAAWFDRLVSFAQT